MSFIAFNFCDNDFHSPLREAVTFLNDNLDLTAMTVDEIKVKIVNAMQAFDTLRNIANDRNVTDHKEYFSSTLTVFEVKSLKELRERNQGEGYVYDTHTGSVSYWGY